jgi:methionyl-tRNA formyltransferase
MIKIGFFGTSEFAKNQFLYLLEHSVPITFVVTQPDKPKGRSLKVSCCPVKKTYLEKNCSFPLFQPAKAYDPLFLDQLKKIQTDLFVVVAYGQILKPSLLAIPPLGCINIHASLLPQYRGAAPIQRAIIEGEKETGITIMQVVEKLDAGDMLLKQKIAIGTDMLFDEVEKKLSDIAGPLLLKVLQQYQEGKIQPIAQDPLKATYASKIKPEDLLLDFSLEATAVHNHIRALSPKPGAYVFCQIGSDIKRLKILQSKIVLVRSFPYHEVCLDKKHWIMGCEKHALEIIKVQLEGKKPMLYPDFIKGLRHKPIIKKL